MRVLFSVKFILYALFIFSNAYAMEEERPVDKKNICTTIYCYYNKKIVINNRLFPLIPGLKEITRTPHLAKTVNNIVECAYQVKTTLRTRNRMLRERAEQPLPKKNGDQYILQQVNDVVKKTLFGVPTDELANIINTAYDLRALYIVNACAKIWLSRLPWPLAVETVRYSANYKKVYVDITNSYLRKHYEIKALQAADELNIFDVMALGNIKIQNSCAYLADKQLTSLNGVADLIDRTDITGLILANNKLTSFRGLPKCGPITSLYAPYNKITKIQPEEFGNNLKSLVLNFNQIAAIENGVFKNLENLEELWLDHNCLTYIDPLAFMGLTNLKLLVLCANKLDKNNINAIRNFLPYTKIIDKEV